MSPSAERKPYRMPKGPRVLSGKDVYKSDLAGGGGPLDIGEKGPAGLEREEAREGSQSAFT